MRKIHHLLRVVAQVKVIKPYVVVVVRQQSQPAGLENLAVILVNQYVSKCFYSRFCRLSAGRHGICEPDQFAEHQRPPCSLSQ